MPLLYGHMGIKPGFVSQCLVADRQAAMPLMPKLQSCFMAQLNGASWWYRISHVVMHGALAILCMAQHRLCNAIVHVVRLKDTGLASW